MEITAVLNSAEIREATGRIADKLIDKIYESKRFGNQMDRVWLKAKNEQFEFSFIAAEHFIRQRSFSDFERAVYFNARRTVVKMIYKSLFD